MLPILPNIPVKAQEEKHKKPIAAASSQTRASKTPRKSIIPFFLFIIGLVLFLSQMIPLLSSIIGGVMLTQQNGVFVPVSANFMQQIISVKYVDPGEQYLSSVIAEVQQPVVNTTYSKLMRISLPASDISRVALTPNVPGNKFDIYDEVLKHGVAHLKGTSLPGDPGLSVIYGHSGISNFFSGKNNPQIIFSRLDTVSIGDTMTIERDGKELSYTVSGKKIVETEDLSFMDAKASKERAILITCWPLGIGTKRLIVIADRIQ